MAKSNFIVRGGADFSGITNALKKTQVQFGTFQLGISKSMQRVTQILGSIAIGKFIKDSTSMAMSVESSIDNITRNMGNYTKSFNEFVNNQAKPLGIAKNAAYTYGSTFSNLLQSFLSDYEKTSTSTTELLKASAIIASKTGKSYDDVANRIRSGMLGSTEAIEDLGVYTNISMIESTNAFKKFANGKSWSQLDFKIQQQIRLAAILEQTYDRYGDTLANTTQSKQALFIASLQNIKLNIGQAFLPIYNVILPALTTLANMLENATAKLATFSQSFFGKAISPKNTLTASAEGVSEYGDAVEEAGKKANKAVAPFDQLNMVNVGSTSSGGSATVGGLTNESADTEETIESLTGLQKLFANLENSLGPSIGKLGDAFRKLGEALKPFTKEIGKGLLDFYEKLKEILVPMTAILIEGFAKALELFSDVISNLSPKTLNDLGYALGAFFTSLVIVNTLASVGKILGTIGKGLSALSQGLIPFASINVMSLSIIFGSLVADLDQWVTTKIGEKFGKIWENIFIILSNVGIGALTGFTFGGIPGAIIGGLIGGILAALHIADYKTVWETFKTSMTTSLNNIFSWETTKQLFKNMIENFKLVLSGNKIGENLIKGLFNGISAALMLLLEPITNLFKEIIKGVKELFGIHSPSKVFEGIGTNIIDGLEVGVKNAWANFKIFFYNIPTHLTNAFDKIKEKFAVKGKDIIDGIKKGWNDNYTSFKTWLSKLPSTIASSIGSLKEVGSNLIKTFVDGLKSIKIPKLDLSIGTTTTTVLGKEISLPKLDIGFYKDGGFPSVGELFVANEAGPELVGKIGNSSVVANNNQITDGIEQAAYKGISRALSENGGLKANVTVAADTKGILKVVQDESKSFKNRTGRPAFN